MRRSQVLALLVLLAPTLSEAQSIFTVAGGGSDDGRAATAANLAFPRAVAFDAVGNLYVADSANHRVRKVDKKTGKISTVAGTGAAGFSGDGRVGWGASLRYPEGLAFDASGNLYIADSQNDRIRRVRAGTGVIETYAGTGQCGSSGDGGPAREASICYPMAVAIDQAGNLLVADSGGNRVRRIDRQSFVITTIAGNGEPESSGDGGPATAASVFGPGALALDGTGNLFIGTWACVRRVDAATGIITTVAGTGEEGFSGDGGPAVSARLRLPQGLAFGPAGDLFISDGRDARIRKVSPAGIITTFAGTGAPSFGGDGGPAAAASLDPRGLALDPDGTGLTVTDMENNRVRRIAFDTTNVFTIAGSGAHGYLGNLGPATAAGLRTPWKPVVGPNGDLFIADAENQRVRRIDRETRTITTHVGGGTLEGDGPRESVALRFPAGLAFDEAGNLYVSDEWDRKIRKVEAATGSVRTIAGTGLDSGPLGDGGPATSARLDAPIGLASDRLGNVFVADGTQNRVRRIDRATGIITTVAGNGAEGYGGDGGPATSATMTLPMDVALDGAGNLYIATNDGRVRRVEAGTGLISTYAGGGTIEGDGVPATQAVLYDPSGLALDAGGNLWIADGWGSRVRKVDGSTRILSTVAGTDVAGFYGDGGPAIEAGLTEPRGVAVDGAGNLYVSDTNANRVRAVLACTTVAAPALSVPAAGATTDGTGVTLSWSAVKGAFRYDVLLDTVNPPARKAAERVVDTVYTVGNLNAGATYYWAVESKGDPYCPSPSSARSEVRSFTTPTACAAPPEPGLASPAPAAADVPLAPTFAWLAAAGTGTYDLHLGTSSPPPVVKGGIAGTSISTAAAGLPALLPGTTYYWAVTARASCDKTKSTVSAVRSFRTVGSCTPPGPFSLSAPADGAAGVPASTTLSWTSSPNAAAYDLYLGAGLIPRLYLSDLVATSVSVGGLKPGTTYRWQVAARAPCSAVVREATPVRSFTVSGECPVPSAPTIAFAPSSVATGQTYVVTWNAAEGLGAGGAYVVERSATSTFAAILDRQATRATNASFLARGTGTYWHRVRAVAGCGSGVSGAPSTPVAVTAVAGAPNVVFSVPPVATVVGIGERLEDVRARFTLENIGTRTVSAILGKAEISSVPFFTIVDPAGGDAVFVSLEPRKPRTFELRFSGPSVARAGAFQGLVFVASQGAGLAVTPYAFVSLKVGASESAAPQILVDGVPSEYAFFDGVSGDDGARSPRTIGVRNPGSLPMEVAAEVGPEVWLVPEPGWNAQPIPPGATREVKLFTKRANAPDGSAYPRYTYLTVRTKSGASARLLVQDNDRPATLAGRAAPLARSTRAFLVPSVVRGTSAIGNTFVSRVLLSNAGNDPVQAELVFTPTETDGWDASRVRRAVVVVPPNDVVTLTDPLVQLFRLTPPAVGALEVRAAPEKIGFLTVTSTVDAASSKGGTFGFQLPTFERGEGARLGEPHVLPGIVATTESRTNLILVETTGLDGVRVRVSLSDSAGNPLGSETVDVPRYGHRQLSGVAGRLGAPGGALALGRLDLEVLSGSGAVASIVTRIDNVTDDSVTFAGRAAPDVASPALAALLAPSAPGQRALADDPLPVKSVIPAVVNGYRTFPGTAAPWTFQSLVGFTSLSSAPATFKLTYRDVASGLTHSATVVVPGRKTVEHENALEELFLLPKGQPSHGPVFVESTPNGILYCKVFSATDTGTLGDSFPVVPIPGESLTGTASLVPLSIDGLEQSVMPGVGTRSNLILNEVSGKPAKVVVRLFEAANRTTPVAEATLDLAAYEKRQLSTVFRELGLDSEERRKDRTNVLCVVTADEASAGLVSAVVTKIDNATGDTKNLLLVPSGGVPPVGGVGIGF